MSRPLIIGRWATWSTKIQEAKRPQGGESQASTRHGYASLCLLGRDLEEESFSFSLHLEKFPLTANEGRPPDHPTSS